MKNFLKVIAWVGLVLFAISTAYSYYTWIAVSSYVPGPMPTQGPEAGYMVVLFLNLLSLLFILPGGLISKPRYFWQPSLAIGLLNIASYWSFSVNEHYWVRTQYHWVGVLIYYIGPAILVIGEGVVLKVIAGKTKIKDQKAESISQP